MTALKSLIDAVISGEEGDAAAAANEALRAGLAIDEIIAAMTAGMREIGDQFARMEIFLPEMVMAAEAMKAAMAELQPEIEKSAQAIEKKGTMVVGTVAGDVHVIGKEIVVRLLRAQGFEVHDLGMNILTLKSSTSQNGPVFARSMISHILYMLGRPLRHHAFEDFDA